MRWFAPVALVGAVGLAACGDDSSDVTARTASAPAAAVGSDVHLANQAAEIEARLNIGSDVHLANQAAEIEAVERGRAAESARWQAQADAYQAAEIEARLDSGSDVHLANQAAETAERQAHLAGNAATHAAENGTSDTSDDEFVPGSRRMPVR